MIRILWYRTYLSLHFSLYLSCPLLGFTEGYIRDDELPKRAVASFNGPTGITVTGDGLRLYVADTGNNAIRLLYIGWQDYSKVKVSTSVGAAPTTAGSSNTADYGGDGVAATAAVINGPQGVWVDDNLNLYFADTFNNLIRVVTNSSYRNYSTGAGRMKKMVNSYFVTLVAGSNGSSSIPRWNLCTANGGKAAIEDTLTSPMGVAVDHIGNIIVADTSANQVKVILNNVYPTQRPTMSPTPEASRAPTDEPTIRPTRMPVTAPPTINPTAPLPTVPLFTYRLVVNSTNDFTRTTGGVYDLCYTMDKLKRSSKNGKPLTSLNSNATVLCSNLRDAWYYCLTRISVQKQKAATYTFPNPSDRPTRCLFTLSNTTAPYILKDSGDKEIQKLGSFMFFTQPGMDPDAATQDSSYNAGGTGNFKLFPATITFEGNVLHIKLGTAYYSSIICSK